MPLLHLSFGGTSVSDISALKGMPLKKLWLPKTAKNIEWLKNVKTLWFINDNLPADFWAKYDAKKKSESKKQDKKSAN